MLRYPGVAIRGADRGKASGASAAPAIPAMFIIWAGTIFARVPNFGMNLSAFLLTLPR